MKKTIVCIIALLPMLAIAQSLERQVIGSAGDYSTGAGISLSSTVGEAVIETATSGSIILTQGFQQPDGDPVGIEIPETGLSITAFPNPTGGAIVIEFESLQSEYVYLTVVNMLGQQVINPLSHHATEGKTYLEIDLTKQAAANYFLKLSNKEADWVKTIQIQKLN